MPLDYFSTPCPDGGFDGSSRILRVAKSAGPDRLLKKMKKDCAPGRFEDTHYMESTFFMQQPMNAKRPRLALFPMLATLLWLLSTQLGQHEQ